MTIQEKAQAILDNPYWNGSYKTVDDLIKYCCPAEIDDLYNYLCSGAAESDYEESRNRNQQ